MKPLTQQTFDTAYQLLKAFLSNRGLGTASGSGWKEPCAEMNDTERLFTVHPDAANHPKQRKASTHAPHGRAEPLVAESVHGIDSNGT